VIGPYVAVGPEDAGRFGWADADELDVRWDGRSARLTVRILDGLAPGMALVPRSAGVALRHPARGEIRRQDEQGG
jgi:anaerobic selenocysteine-containing dehydrogenase